MEIAFLHEKLKEISQILREKYRESQQTGILVGTSGIALFYFYYSKFMDTDEFADVGAEILTDGIERINNGYVFPTYCAGLAGIGWTMDHLKQWNFVDVESDELLSELDNYLYNIMISNIRDGNYDFLHGALGYGFYFLKRYENSSSEGLKKQYKSYLEELINLLSEQAEIDDNGVKWLSVIHQETGEKGYNLSLSHGMSSIVNFLSRLSKHDVYRTKVSSLLEGGIAFILDHKNKSDSNSSLFPSWVKDEENKSGSSRLAWCYGDLGIGVSLWQASKSLNDPKLGTTAVEILKYASQRTSPEDSMVKDAGLCHGSFGNAQIFNRMYAETGEETFREAAAFWIGDGLKQAVHKNGYAGFKQWMGEDNEWREKLSLLEGIAGIGLGIISHLSGDNSWDECLMIG